MHTGLSPPLPLGVSPFDGSLGYQPPLFQEQKEELAVQHLSQDLE